MRRLYVVVLIAVLMLIGVPAAAAPRTAPAPSPSPSPSPGINQQINDASAQQTAINAAKDSLKDEIDAATATQAQLEDLITANQKAVQKTMAKLAAAQARFTAATDQAAQEQGIAAAALIRATTDKRVLAAYLREQYASYNDMFAYILEGSSIGDIIERAGTAQNTGDAVREMTSAVQTDVNTAQAAAQAAQAAANAAQSAAADLSAERDALTAQSNNAQMLIGKLDVQQRQANAELAAADGQDAALAQKIANLRIQQIDNTIEQAETADWQAAEYYIQHNITDFPGLDGKPIDLKPGSGSATLIWPVPGTTITQGFGPSAYPFEPALNGYPHFHTGIDLAGPLNTPIYAAGAGVVVAATESTVGYGNHIIIAHPNGLLTLYGHLNTIVVKVGDQVNQGQLIGLLGSTGNSTGPHCHFEVRLNGTPVNPLPFLPALPPGATGPPRK